MANESVREGGRYFLPPDLVDEANKLACQSSAVLECMIDASGAMDAPEKILDGIGWLLRDHVARMKEICNARSDVTDDEYVEIPVYRKTADEEARA